MTEPAMAVSSLSVPSPCTKERSIFTAVTGKRRR
jgi:hypothetical protein